MSELLCLTLVELSAALRAKKASPVELMRDVFRALDLHNPDLNAVIAQRDREALLTEAREAERRIQGGLARALEGIPFGVKDLEDVQGMATSHGSRPFRERVAERDSTQVARLKAAGAIVLGKTNTPEFGASALTKNVLFGTTRSPWDRERTPGGSSGGAAAALAGELLPLVTASDGGGSIRIPASYVGAFGLKPSFGRIPRGPLGHWEHGATIVNGPLSKTVEDAGLILELVAGPDPSDPTSLPAPGLSYFEAARRPLEHKLRVAYSPDLGRAVVQSDLAAVVEDAARSFERLGHQLALVRGGPPDLSAEWTALNALRSAAQAAHLRPERDPAFGHALVASWGEVEALSPTFWASLAQKRARLGQWCAELFARFDVLLTPTVPFDPPPAKGPLPSATEGRPQPAGAIAAFTLPFNMSWHPAASVRAGRSRAGLPVGLQVVAPAHREDLLLALARAFERERPAHPDWPLRRSPTSRSEPDTR